jgi:hypothetical protein
MHRQEFPKYGSHQRPFASRGYGGSDAGCGAACAAHFTAANPGASPDYRPNPTGSVANTAHGANVRAGLGANAAAGQLPSGVSSRLHSAATARPRLRRRRLQAIPGSSTGPAQVR